jgi:hypothetical protein
MNLSSVRKMILAWMDFYKIKSEYGKLKSTKVERMVLNALAKILKTCDDK